MRKFEGWTYVPVMCMREMPVPNSLKMCVRIMMHVNTDILQKEINHVYLKEATVLKTRPWQFSVIKSLRNKQICTNGVGKNEMERAIINTDSISAGKIN